jgi:hypothetical protein
MDAILRSQVHDHIIGFGERQILSENLEFQDLELTTEDREDHTFNGTRRRSSRKK